MFIFGCTSGSVVSPTPALDARASQPAASALPASPPSTMQGLSAESAELEITGVSWELTAESVGEVLSVTYTFAVRNKGAVLENPRVDGFLKDPSGAVLQDNSVSKAMVAEISDESASLGANEEWDSGQLFIPARNLPGDFEPAQPPFPEGAYSVEAKLYDSENADAKLLATATKQFVVKRA